MIRLLEQGLHSRNGVVRKGCALALQAPKQLARSRSCDGDRIAAPPVLANSLPKSGTHLLDQIVEALPDCRNYGAFLSSMTSSFRFTRRTSAQSCRFLHGSAPGEIVRAHLFYDEQVEAALDQLRFVHFFIYRDPRDVVLSETHYYRSINRWHRLHPYFRDAPSLDHAIMLAIQGVDDPRGRIYYPHVGVRFQHYQRWISHPAVCAVRFEELTSADRQHAVLRMIRHYLDRSAAPADAEALCRRALDNITPEKSHTFRQGKRGGWREAFHDEHRAVFKQLAGPLLVEHASEADGAW
ncbi:MAG: sulfotransferase domain-containing protein [Pirellulales bacterium]|nr:sulfotransferase domain-containing protein [Pirellulales bacterium]